MVELARVGGGKRIAIIGAGIAGLSCAIRLIESGLTPVVFDKSRGVGGRMATRRTESGLQFDHGAQYLTARTASFQSAIFNAQKAGTIDLWRVGGDDRYVGVPGMNGLAKFLSKDIDIHLQSKVDEIRDTQHGCEIISGNQEFSFDKVVATVPAPQALALIDDQHHLSEGLAEVTMGPCHTLMAAFASDHKAPFTMLDDPEDDISWLAHDSSKPGRSTQNCWVAHANPQWSAKNLEADPNVIAQRLLPKLCDRIGVSPSQAIHVAGHRWRYASVLKPLGRPFLSNSCNTLYLGGDWCLEARVEAAWTSGTEIAMDIVKNV